MDEELEDIPNFYIGNLSQEDLIKTYFELLDELEELRIQNKDYEDDSDSSEEDELYDRLDTVWLAFSEESIKRVNETLTHLSKDDTQE